MKENKMSRNNKSQNGRKYGNKNYRKRNAGGGYRKKRRRYRGSKSNISQDKYIAKAVNAPKKDMYVSSYKYHDLDLQESLKQNIIRRYTNPTKIQDQAIPQIMEGKDILGLASTGSGKTAAFLIPLIDKVLRMDRQQCLTIVPTRDLAYQIQKEFKRFTQGINLRSTLIIGGNSANKQIHQLKKKPEFIFGTPGRLKDLTNRKALKLRYVNNIVLDEVDRMMDMGFINDIRYLISRMNKQKQSLFFSATMSTKAENVARTFLQNPVKIQIEKQSPGKNVDQDIVKVKSERDKVEKLHDILNKDDVKKTLVFTRTKRGADRVHRELKQRGFNSSSIHGGKSQSKRKRVIRGFRSNSVEVLVATDVASRGLDIKNITHVINFDEPANYKDYIHRIGRTGRIGKKGTALTFVK